ncbi:Major facilitator superfamily domain general substrate transporter [Colletotrichum asianum]
MVCFLPWNFSLVSNHDYLFQKLVKLNFSLAIVAMGSSTKRRFIIPSNGDLEKQGYEGGMSSSERKGNHFELVTRQDPVPLNEWVCGRPTGGRRILQQLVDVFKHRFGTQTLVRQRSTRYASICHSHIFTVCNEGGYRISENRDALNRAASASPGNGSICMYLPMHKRSRYYFGSGTPKDNNHIHETISTPFNMTEPHIDEKSGETPEVAELNASDSYKKDYRFWAILFALCITSLLASLENTVIVTSLPTIVEKLEFGSSYVWVANISFLTSAAVQPLFGQLSNLFGRRYLTIAIVALFTLGSSICGGANGPAMLIAGRAIQGAGSGGINMIVDIIISDLVPLRERGNCFAIILVTYGIGTAIGPLVGGIIVQKTSWRWVFYINQPVGGLSLVLLYLFLHVKWDRTSMTGDKLRRIDVIGNVILRASTVSVLIALTWAGAIHPWSSYKVIVPLILGLLGLAGFCVFEDPESSQSQ